MRANQRQGPASGAMDGWVNAAVHRSPVGNPNRLLGRASIRVDGGVIHTWDGFLGGPDRRKSVLLGLAATCFVAMPLVFLLTRPAVTAEEAASILAEGEGLQQVEPNEAYSTMEMQNGGSFWVQRGYVFQGTSEMGEVIVFCFDPMQVQWGALRH